MILKNALVCTENFELKKTDIEIADGKIAKIGSLNTEGIDFSGKVILPGFVDIHIHGCLGSDCTDGKDDSVLKMSSYLASKGVTSFCPTTMTLPENDLLKCFGYINSAMGKEPGAYIHGINMEGPFISEKKKGAQAAEHIRKPDIEMFDRLSSVCNIKLCDIAPEEDDGFKFIEYAKSRCTVSIAHTSADYGTATSAIKKGASHATHLFNAMSQFSSREPGVVGAFFDSRDTFCEMICDTIHIAPASLRIAFSVLGEDRTVVISDAMMAAGLKDGFYALGGQDVIKAGNTATLKDGTLAGSVTNIFDEFRNLISIGIPFRQAVKSVSLNPAKSIGVQNVCGSIEIGKNADLTVLDSEMENILQVYVKGKPVFG